VLSSFNPRLFLKHLERPPSELQAVFFDPNLSRGEQIGRPTGIFIQYWSCVGEQLSVLQQHCEKLL